jgi:hypothetical protein
VPDSSHARGMRRSEPTLKPRKGIRSNAIFKGKSLLFCPSHSFSRPNGGLRREYRDHLNPQIHPLQKCEQPFPESRGNGRVPGSLALGTPMPPAVAERPGPTTPSTVRRDYPSSLVAHNGFEPGVEFHSAIRAHRGRALRSAPADLSAVGSTVVRFAIPSRRRRNPTHGLTLVSREPRSRSGSLKDILSVAEQGFFGIAGSAGVAMNSTGTR